MKLSCFSLSPTEVLELGQPCLPLQVLLRREDAKDGEEKVRVVDLNKLTRKDKEFIVERALEVSCMLLTCPVQVQTLGDFCKAAACIAPKNGICYLLSGTPPDCATRQR